MALTLFQGRRRRASQPLSLLLPVAAAALYGTAYEYNNSTPGTNSTKAMLANGLGAFAGFVSRPVALLGDLGNDIFPGRVGLSLPFLAGQPGTFEDFDTIEAEGSMLYALNSVVGGTVTTPGSYTTLPAITVTGDGSAATAGAILGLLTAVIHSGGGGTAYAINDTINLVQTGATKSIELQLKVTGVSAGVITTVSINVVGAYTVLPSNASSTVVQATTSGAGTGATFDLTYKVVGINITAVGTGYTTAGFTFGAGSAAATAVLAGAITANNLTPGVSNLSFAAGLVCLATGSQNAMFKFVDYITPAVAGNTRIYAERIHG